MRVTRLWKLAVVIAGALGLLGFFVPLAAYRSPSGLIRGGASGFQIARDLDDPGGIARKASDLGLSPETSRQLAQRVHDDLDAYRGAVGAIFALAGLLAGLGLVLLLRDRMARLDGLVAAAIGGACIAVVAWCWQIDQDAGDPSASLGPGVYLLAAAGLGALAAGLGALISPDRGRGA